MTKKKHSLELSEFLGVLNCLDRFSVQMSWLPLAGILKFRRIRILVKTQTGFPAVPTFLTNEGNQLPKPWNIYLKLKTNFKI